MFKKIVGLVMVALLLSAQCFAMTLSQPEKIARIGYINLGGFDLSDASSNSGEKIKNNYRGNRQLYEKGLARFGNGSNALYFHYKHGTYENKYNDTIMSFGAQDINNTVNVNILTPTIFRIDTDEGITLYMFDDGYDLAEESYYTLIGKRKDGRWVKYFDTDTVRKNYFGESMWGIAFYKPVVSNNTIIIHYDRNTYGHQLQRNNINETGEFRFKWDNNAQWFGVERVVY